MASSDPRVLAGILAAFTNTNLEVGAAEKARDARFFWACQFQTFSPSGGATCHTPLQIALDHHKDAPLISVEALHSYIYAHAKSSVSQLIIVHRTTSLRFFLCLLVSNCKLPVLRSTMAAMSAAAMTVSGSAMTAPATTLSSSAAFGSSGAQQLGALRSPASLNAPRIVAVRASHSSQEQRPVKSKALVALVAAGAAFVLNVTPVPTSGDAIALDLNSLIDNVKELSSNIPSSDGDEGKTAAVELAKRAAKRVAKNAARDFASGDGENKTSSLLDSVKELAGNIPNLEGNQEAKNAAIDIAKNAAQGAATNAAQDSNSNTASNLIETVKSLSGKIPGFDGDKVVQSAAVDIAKNTAQSAATNAARDFADTAKNRIGMEAGKALLNKFTGNDN